MKSSFVFAALVGFALLNTAFLGAYLYSSAGFFGGASAGASQTISGTTSGIPTQTVTTMSTVTNTMTVASASSGSTSAPSATSSGVSVSAETTPGASVAGTVTGTASENASYSTGVASVGGVSSLSVLSVVQFFESHSLALAPSSWVAVGGMWIWRGRMRSKWTDLGFDSDVFGLFVKMKGGKTRIRLLDALSLPKDRLQLAQELGLDWKGVDRHLMVMKKYGFVDDRVAYGKVRMYQLTPMGASLLRLLQDLSREENRQPISDPALFQGNTFSN
jgi:hypothetical protein